MSNYNQAHLIEKAIDSVLMQKTDFAWQLIITDDCSVKDNSIEIINSYVTRFPDKIKAIFSENNGGYLRNILRAKNITKTDYFTLLDADDYWTDENYLQEAIDFLRFHPEFTIYSRNSICLMEDGSTRLFIDTDLNERDFSLNNLLDNTILIPQTTGGVFRNVIYIHGIPEIVSNSLGTISERSFEGDAGRFIMHLKYGKSHFVNRSSGVYRILSSGIWSRLNQFEKHILLAQGNIDYYRFFDNKYDNYFITKANDELKSAIKYLENLNDYCTEKAAEISDEFMLIFSNVLNICYKNKNSIVRREKPKRLKYRIMLNIYNLLKQKLQKKNII